MFANIGFCNPSWISGSELPDPWFWWQGQQFLTLRIQIHMVDARPGTPLVTPGDTLVTYPISESAQQRGSTCYFRLLFGMIRSVEDISLSPDQNPAGYGRLMRREFTVVLPVSISINQTQPETSYRSLPLKQLSAFAHLMWQERNPLPTMHPEIGKLLVNVCRSCRSIWATLYNRFLSNGSQLEGSASTVSSWRGRTLVLHWTWWNRSRRNLMKWRLFQRCNWQR